MGEITRVYRRRWRPGIPAEDARLSCQRGADQFPDHGQLRRAAAHRDLRLCTRAQWESADVARMRSELNAQVPDWRSTCSQVRREAHGYCDEEVKA